MKRVIIFIIAVTLMAMIPGVAAAKEIKWRMGTTWVPAIATLFGADQTFVKIVNDMCKGELSIKLHQAGEIVPAFETFGAVQANTLQAGGDVPFYWAGKDSAFTALGALPMGLSQMDFLTWIYQAGGLDVYNEVYGKFGMIYFPYAAIPAESGVRGKFKIKSLDDFKGKKIRMAGLIQGKMLNDLGAVQVMIATPEMYQALERGMIDGGELGGPYLDWNMGIHEITTEWNGPGWHQPCSIIGVMINKKAWDELPPNVQNKVRYAAMATMIESTTNANMVDYAHANKWVEKGVGMNILGPEDLAKIQEMAFKAFEDEAQKNPLFAKVVYSQYKYLETAATFKKIQAPVDNRPPMLPNMELLKKAAEGAK